MAVSRDGPDSVGRSNSNRSIGCCGGADKVRGLESEVLSLEVRDDIYTPYRDQKGDRGFALLALTPAIQNEGQAMGIWRGRGKWGGTMGS